MVKGTVQKALSSQQLAAVCVWDGYLLDIFLLVAKRESEAEGEAEDEACTEEMGRSATGGILGVLMPLIAAVLSTSIVSDPNPPAPSQHLPLLPVALFVCLYGVRCSSAESDLLLFTKGT